jgi:O-acetyl-ADP-ribose deacetylase (regulator of RNase III)
MSAMVERQLPGGTIRLVQGDITELDVDAIVNAANAHLAGGGGVDGAIHRRGGPTIMAETRQKFPDGCPTGGAVTTGAGELPALYVIHAVGPRWGGGAGGEERLLASAWRAALAEAVDNACARVAFPSISTGIYGFPVERAAAIAMAEVVQALGALQRGRRLEVVVCAFSDADRAAYEQALEAIQIG